MSDDQLSEYERIRHAVRDARAARGWSQGELARRANVSRPTIARLETGHSVSSTTLLKLLATLDLRLTLDSEESHR